MKTCTWRFDFDGYWATGCKKAFDLYIWTPKEHEMEFCCFCGKKIKVKND